MKHLYFIHGFLGVPSDWNFIESTLDYLKISCIDLSDPYSPEEGFEAFAKKLNRIVDPSKENYLIGYSLGGRLALHVLSEDSSLWKGSMIVSANPGLEDDQGKSQRIVMDASWALRFLVQDWKSLMEKWDAQPVFSSSKKVERFEENYQRESLCDMITHWSLGRQENLRDSISNLSMPLYWVVGEKDDKFVKLSSQLTFKNGQSKVITMKGAGHRAPWDNQAEFIKILTTHLLDTK